MDDVQKKFLEAYDLYSEPLYRHCFFRVFSKARAEELVSETFVKAWQYAQTGKEIKNIRAFLYKIANNLIIDESRKKKEESLHALIEESESFEPAHDGRHDIEQHALFQEVLSVIHLLSHPDRQILIMRYVDDLDLREIAEIMGITVNNASVKLTRMIKLLREDPRLREENPDFGVSENI